MQNLPYINRDYESVFNSIKDIITTLEPRAEVSDSKANVESIIAKIVAGCVDCLSYNQDANIFEAFPSTSRDARSVFDLLSIVGYVPKTAMCSKVYMSLWNPNYEGTKQFDPFNNIIIDGKKFYNPDKFSCSSGSNPESTIWYQGSLISPDKKLTKNDNNEFIDGYYPNLSASTIRQDLYALPESHTNIDSRTIRVYTEDGDPLTYVENPYMVYTTKSSFSLLPTVNSTGYSLIFSKDVSSGVVSDNYYYFYLLSEGYSIGDNLTPDFSSLHSTTDSGTSSYNFTFSYTQEASKEPETANEARENIAYEFGWRDTPKAIITKYDAERAILQNRDIVAAVDVRDRNNYSGGYTAGEPVLGKFDVYAFVKLTELAELTTTKDSVKNTLVSYIDKFKTLPLNFNIFIDDEKDTEGKLIIGTKIYYWYPTVTIYLKEQVSSQEASAIITQAYSALFKRYAYSNLNFNTVPRIVDIVETIQNASDTILYLDFDGITYVDPDPPVDSDKKPISYVPVQSDITCSFTKQVNYTDNNKYNIILETTDSSTKYHRYIQYHTVKIVDKNNIVIGIDNGEGKIISQNGYLDDSGTINHQTGELNINFIISPSSDFYVSYKQETPTWCSFIDSNSQSIKIALESIRA